MSDELINSEVSAPDQQENVVTEDIQPDEISSGADVVSDFPDATEESPEYTSDETAGKKKKIKLWIIIAAAVLIAAAVCAFLFSDGPGFSYSVGSAQARNTSYTGRKDNDGIVWVPDFKGNVAEMDEEVISAVISPDRKHIVSLYEDGRICWALNGEKEEEADDDVREIIAVRNSGFAYVDNDGTLRRVLYGKDPEKVCKEVQYSSIALDSLSILAFADGKVYIMAENSEEAVKVSKYKGAIAGSSISNDGSFAVWSDKASSEFTIRCAINLEDEKLGSFDSSSSTLSVNYTLDQKIAVVLDLNADKLWVYRNGKLMEVELEDNATSSAVCCIRGRLDGVKASDVDDIYCMIDDDDASAVYMINQKGETEKVISSVHSFWISDGKAVWLNDDYKLYSGKLKGSEIKDKTKLCSDARGIVIADDSSIAFFMKDCEDGECDLYAYKLGSGEPVKIASGVHCWMYSFLEDYAGSSFQSCIDGKTVLFWKDVEVGKDTGDSMGTLYKWTWGDDKPTKIAQDSICGYSVDGLSNSTYNQNGFLYLVYSDSNDSGDALCDWYFFDGTGSMKLAENIVY